VAQEVPEKAVAVATRAVESVGFRVAALAVIRVEELAVMRAEARRMAALAVVAPLAVVKEARHETGA
jgi:hypothetical protein